MSAPWLVPEQKGKERSPGNCSGARDVCGEISPSQRRRKYPASSWKCWVPAQFGSLHDGRIVARSVRHQAKSADARTQRHDPQQLGTRRHGHSEIGTASSSYRRPRGREDPLSRGMRERRLPHNTLRPLHASAREPPCPSRGRTAPTPSPTRRGGADPATAARPTRSPAHRPLSRSASPRRH